MIRIGILFLIVLYLSGCATTDLAKVEKFQARCPELSKEDRLARVQLPYFRPSPSYPAEAMRRGIEGYVVFEFDISTEGSPINSRVIESFPSDMFVNAATDSFRGYKYKPILEDEKAVISECHEIKLDFVFEK